MKVRYSRRAISDLKSIADYLSSRSPVAAGAVGSAIADTVKLIGEFPGSGRSVEQRPSVRVIPLGRFPYLVFYTAESEAIIILHIRHGGRRPIEPDEL